MIFEQTCSHFSHFILYHIPQTGCISNAFSVLIILTHLTIIAVCWVTLSTKMHLRVTLFPHVIKYGGPPKVRSIQILNAHNYIVFIITNHQTMLI